MALSNEPYTSRKGLTMITFTKSDLNFLIHFYYWWEEELTDHQTVPRPWYTRWLPQYIMLVSQGEVEFTTVDYLVQEANNAWVTIDASTRVRFMNHYHLVLQREVEWEMRWQRRIEA